MSNASLRKEESRFEGSAKGEPRSTGEARRCTISAEHRIVKYRPEKEAPDYVDKERDASPAGIKQTASIELEEAPADTKQDNVSDSSDVEASAAIE